jgi:hypothetical protein
MNDKQLNSLIRMAGEVDRLEVDAGLAPPNSLTFYDAKSQFAAVRRLALAVGGLVAAACLTIVAVNALKPAAVPKAGEPVRIAEVPAPEVSHEIIAPFNAPVVTPVRARSGEDSVLMAVFRDADDRCTCVQVRPQDWGEGRRLSEVTRAEILRAAISGACHTNPERVLVIAMSGPAGSLPRSTAEAEILAACMTEGPASCDDDTLCFASNAMAFLPPGVTVLAESMAFAR